jgi:hypothetical protein
LLFQKCGHGHDLQIEGQTQIAQIVSVVLFEGVSIPQFLVRLLESLIRERNLSAANPAAVTWR